MEPVNVKVFDWESFRSSLSVFTLSGDQLVDQCLQYFIATVERRENVVNEQWKIKDVIAQTRYIFCILFLIAFL
jgi:hypothetical protein